VRRGRTYPSQSSSFLLATIHARELITTLPSKSASTHSVISIFPVHSHVVHDSLLLLRAEVILAPFDSTASVGTGAGEVVLAIPVGEAHDAPALSFRGTQVMRRLAILVKVARYLAVSAGVVATTASKAGWFCASRGRCASSKTVGLGLVVLALPLAELWVLPYKGPEVARSVSANEVSPHLFLALSMLPPLVLVTQPLLPREELEALDVSVLAVELIRPTPTVPESDYIGVHPVISQPLQGSVKSAVHHVGFGQEGQVFFVVGWRGAPSLDW
jgi:hypothetical protein